MEKLTELIMQITTQKGWKDDNLLNTIIRSGDCSFLIFLANSTKC